MITVKCGYNLKNDIGFILETEKISISELSEKTGISRTTIDEIMKNANTTSGVCEKFYSYVYDNKYRINSVIEELLKEQYKEVLFHGSKSGLYEITIDGSRDNCDLVKGFIWEKHTIRL